MRVSTSGLVLGFAIGTMAPANTAPIAAVSGQTFRVAQAMAPIMAPIMAPVMGPLAGPGGTDRPDSAEQRMRRRFPQPVRVGDLIGMPVLDDRSRTLGLVRAVVRTPQGKIEMIVAYDGWFGWGTRPVAVPIEVVGIQGRELASLDMPRAGYAAAPTWRQTDETAISDTDSISVALSRR
jgi:hypothetical protein